MEKTNQSLKDRMKFYESEVDSKLDLNKPIIARIDGQAFHTWTKQFKKEFNTDFEDAMKYTMMKLCENLPVTMGYTQSDEITLVFDAKESWFKGRIQKITSLLASRATYYFNKRANLTKSLNHNEPAFFDARVFNVPDIDEVKNCLFFRQSDGKRNYISKRARQSFTMKELHKKNSNEVIEMLAQKGEKWDDNSQYFIYGAVSYRVPYFIQNGDDLVERHYWTVQDVTKMFNTNWQILDEILIK